MRSFILSLVFCILIPACGDDSNHAPSANAGPDQNIANGSVVILDAGDSSDTDGDSITYAWSFQSLPEGSSAVLSDTTSVRPTFTADLDGGYVLQLVVSDGSHKSDPDFVTVNASTANSAPVADAGADRNVVTGSLVTLDASASSDADNDILTYSWNLISIPDGSDAALSDASAAAPTFTADLDGDYLIQLIVHDDASDSSPDTVTVTATTANSAPVANAGADRNVATGSQVTLDASASSDADNDILTYSWSLINAPDGSGAELSDAVAAEPALTPDLDGIYVLQLIVNDGTVNSEEDTVLISAAFLAPVNHVAANFTIDDTGNPTYGPSDGLAWKGSFRFDPITRILTFDGAWSGPYPLLYDDGPWTDGGHEPEGATAGDHVWGVAVWVSNAATRTFEYGAISGSVDGSDGIWIWSGANGFFIVPANSSNPIDAPGLVIP